VLSSRWFWLWCLGGKAGRMFYDAIGGPATLYRRLTDRYRLAITQGDLRPGARFPSVRELADLHQVGGTTASRIHATLLSLGLIEHRSGIGTFVRASGRGDAVTARPVPVLRIAVGRLVTACDDSPPRSEPHVLSDTAQLTEAVG
jgi:DNA-binding transcriptional regulator YhcF (GntR family)